MISAIDIDPIKLEYATNNYVIRLSLPRFRNHQAIQIEVNISCANFILSFFIRVMQKKDCSIHTSSDINFRFT